MDDRTGILMTASLLVLAAIEGSDADVKLAASGDQASMAYLAGKWGNKAVAMMEAMKRIAASYSNAQREARRYRA